MDTRVQYKKRIKGGYYAFVTPEDETRGSYVIIVEPHTGTSKVGVTDYWTARKMNQQKTLSHTRKDAVRKMVEQVEGSR